MNICQKLNPLHYLIPSAQEWVVNVVLMLSRFILGFSSVAFMFMSAILVSVFALPQQLWVILVVLLLFVSGMYGVFLGGTNSDRFNRRLIVTQHIVWLGVAWLVIPLHAILAILAALWCYDHHALLLLVFLALVNNFANGFFMITFQQLTPIHWYPPACSTRQSE